MIHSRNAWQKIVTWHAAYILAVLPATVRLRLSRGRLIGGMFKGEAKVAKNLLICVLQFT
jgi:hypothetical protein